MSARTNWKAMQVAGCKKATFSIPRDVKPKHMAMGSWHADLSKEGTRRRKGGQG